MPKGSVGDKLAPEEMVMRSILRGRSTFQRAKLLMMALRLACQDMEGYTIPRMTERQLVLGYVATASVVLEGDGDA